MIKVAVFGGSGFLGHEFIRIASTRGGVTLVVHSSGVGNVANVCRHAVDVRPDRAAEADGARVDADTDFIISFAHPFQQRDGADGAAQIQRFVRLVQSAVRANPKLRLIYISSMAVFEPFTPGRRFVETDPLKPPQRDRYANEKVLAETLLRRLPDADRWQLHLRPTIVYGPFCRPFADRLFEMFRAGDVRYRNLSGRIQPIYGEDIARFLYDRVFDFTPGLYNVAGPEEMSWGSFVSTFRDIVGRGALVVAADHVTDAPNSLIADVRGVVRAARRDPAFDRIAGRIARRVPGALSFKVRRLLSGSAMPEAADEVAAGNAALFMSPYFAQDRLVADRNWRRDFPGLQLSRLNDRKAVMAEYYRFRFSDDRFV